MKVLLLVVGKTTTGYVRQGIEDYVSRLGHYVKFELRALDDVRGTRGMTAAQQCAAEGRSIVACLERSDHVVLLDEYGRQPTSMEMAGWLQRRMASGVKRVVFIVGGPYGFSDEVRGRANEQISLSRMTFPHELVRLIFVEQLYRAFTILHHEKYHNN